MRNRLILILVVLMILFPTIIFGIGLYLYFQPDVITTIIVPAVSETTRTVHSHDDSISWLIIGGIVFGIGLIAALAIIDENFKGY